MRKLVVFLIVMSTALATCADYVTSAENDFSPGCDTGQCFGVAGRYKEAANCFALEGKKVLADFYYQKAIDSYLQGRLYMGPAGDYPLRAQSYENAADTETQLGNTELAVKYYDLAADEYLKTNEIQNVNAVLAKKTLALQPVLQNNNLTGFAIFSSQNIITGIIVLVVAIALYAYLKRPEEPVPVKMDFTAEPMTPISHATPRIDPAKESAKEKMRDKIRKKYGLA